MQTALSSALASHKVLLKVILHRPSESVKLKHTQASVHGPMWNQAWSLVSKDNVMAILMYRRRFTESPSLPHMVQITPFYAFCAISVNSAQPAFPLKFNRWPRLFLWLRTRWSCWLEFKGHIVGMGGYIYMYIFIWIFFCWAYSWIQTTYMFVYCNSIVPFGIMIVVRSPSYLSWMQGIMRGRRWKTTLLEPLTQLVWQLAECQP